MQTRPSYKKYDHALMLWRRVQVLWGKLSKNPVDEYGLKRITGFRQKSLALFQELAKRDFLSANAYTHKIFAMQTLEAHTRNYAAALAILRQAEEFNEDKSEDILSSYKKVNLYTSCLRLLKHIPHSSFPDAHRLQRTTQHSLNAAVLHYHTLLSQKKQTAELKSLIFRFRSLYQISGPMTATFMTALETLARTQLQLSCYLSDVFLFRERLARANQLGKAIPLEQLQARRAYIRDLEMRMASDEITSILAKKPQETSLEKVLDDNRYLFKELSHHEHFLKEISPLLDSLNQQHLHLATKLQLYWNQQRSLSVKQEDGPSPAVAPREFKMV